MGPLSEPSCTVQPVLGVRLVCIGLSGIELDYSIPSKRKRSCVPDTFVRRGHRFRLLRTPSVADGLVRARHGGL
jgi:hypothetical protein